MRQIPTLPAQQRAAEIRAASFDEAANTIDVVFTTGAAVRRRSWADGPFDEVLVVEPGSVRLGRLNAGAPFLNTHDDWSLRSVLGSVVPGSARIENGQGLATILLSRRPEVAGIMQDIRDGVIRNISVGYRYHEVVKIEGQDGSPAVWRVTDWEPLEISAVPVPADPGSQIRAGDDGQHFPFKIRTGARPMDGETINNSVPADAVRIERERCDTIRRLTAKHGKAEMGDEHIRAGTPLQEFRGILLDHLADEQPEMNAEAPTNLHFGRSQNYDNPNFFATFAGEALFSRLNPAHALSEAARPLAHMRLADMARNILGRRGNYFAKAVSDSEAITRALNSTSDFPLLLANVTERSVRAAYDAAPSGLKMVARQATQPNFKGRSRLQTSQFSALEKVNEGGEFKRGSFEESGESYKIESFGKIFGITRQALINDDLSVFDTVPRKLGIAAAAFEANQLSGLLKAGGGLGPLMSDGKRVFHADHGNLLTAPDGEILGVPAISAARLAMRKQTDESGQLIGVTPRFLVVGPELETTAEQVLATIAASEVETVNPFSGRLTLIVEPRIDDESWFVAAAPNEVDGIEYSYLEGSIGPQIEYKPGFDVDGMEIKVRLDFGCAFIDWRSWVRNAN